MAKISELRALPSKVMKNEGETAAWEALPPAERAAFLKRMGQNAAERLKDYYGAHPKEWPSFAALMGFLNAHPRMEKPRRNP